MNDEKHRAACSQPRYRPHWWDTDATNEEHRIAANICATCPIAQTCLDTARGEHLTGIYGGVLIGNGIRNPQGQPGVSISTTYRRARHRGRGKRAAPSDLGLHLAEAVAAQQRAEYRDDDWTLEARRLVLDNPLEFRPSIAYRRGRAA